MASFSKRTILISMALVGLVAATVVCRNGWGLVVGLLATLGFVALKVCGFHQRFFAPPRQFALRRADLTDVTSSQLGPYYVHADGQNIPHIAAGVYCRPPFDERGIPLVDYGPGVGHQYNACTIAQYAIEHWVLYLKDRDARHRETFLQQADWLEQALDAGRWYFRFPMESRGMGNPWISAMAQGQGISVLLRAWQCTGEPRYYHGAEAALAVLRTPIRDGGVCLPTPDGTWFEEYPSVDHPDHVLNGHIWALFGIWDSCRACNNPATQQLFDAGVKILLANLHRYDTGYWVWYDLREKSFLVDNYYMYFQIDQLQVLHAITGQALFDEYVRRWRAYQHSLRSLSRVTTHALSTRFRRRN